MLIRLTPARHRDVSVVAPGQTPVVGIVERGRQGPKGDTGERGPSGAGTTIQFDFAQPLTTWTIVHSLGRYPSVTTVDTANDQMIGAMVYLDSNSLQITFSAPTAGTAYLN